MEHDDLKQEIATLTAERDAIKQEKLFREILRREMLKEVRRENNQLRSALLKARSHIESFTVPWDEKGWAVLGEIDEALAQPAPDKALQK
jgi:hypothetical protein